VLFYLCYKRSNLVWPMITGRRQIAPPRELKFAPIRRTTVAALVAIAVTSCVAKGFHLQ
jgi:hypothetical protein